MILGATMVATCEAFVLAQKLGLDPQVFFDISSKASGQSWSMTSYCPVPGVGPETPADHDYEGGFAAALMLKDLKLAAEAAQSVGAYTPMGGEAEELYQRFVDRGGGGKDFSGIIKMIDDSWKVPPNNRSAMRIALSCRSLCVARRLRRSEPARPITARQISDTLAAARQPMRMAMLAAARQGAGARIMHERHEGMETIGKANKALHRELDCGSPDLGVDPRSAATIADLSQKASGWFPAGTGPEVGKTGAKPEIWQNPKDFAAKLRDFQAAAQAFDAAAASE